jgi:hypothetical protein
MRGRARAPMCEHPYIILPFLPFLPFQERSVVEKPVPKIHSFSSWASPCWSNAVYFLHRVGSARVIDGRSQDRR